MELHQDPADVALRGALLNRQPQGDLRVRESLSDEAEDIALARGQRLELRRVLGPRPRHEGELLDQAACDRGIDEGIARRDAPHCCDQLFAWGILEEKAARAAAKSGVD